MALAALTPPAPPADGEPVRAGGDWLHLLLPYVPVVATGVVIAVRTGTGGGLTKYEAYLGWLGLGLVVARRRNGHAAARAAARAAQERSAVG